LIGLAQRCVRPNPLYGFRVTKTPYKTRIWHDTNAYARWRLLCTGIAIVLTTPASGSYRGSAWAAMRPPARRWRSAVY
jgi:hypothetical protein